MLLHRTVMRVLGTLIVCASLGGCAADVAHLGRAVVGHLSVLQSTRPVDHLIRDEGTPADLRQRLILARDIRNFASRELGLPDNASYRRYGDIGRSHVLWNVVAAPPLSFDLKTWCYPVTGCVGYRGHFDLARAQTEAEQLRQEGYEVYLYGVPAYSTLGRTDLFGGDPLLNTFALSSPIELARLLFHELAHQVVYAPGDMAFSESFATAVERLGLERWAADAGSRAVSPQEWERWHVHQQRRRELAALLDAHRARLQALYRSRMADDARLQRKAELQQRLMAEYASLRDSAWQGDRRFDSWVGSLNNASLALQSSYEDAVPGFIELFEREGRDFKAFYRAARAQAAALPRITP